MRRWDGLVERYAQLNATRDLADGTIEKRVRELERLGSWLKRRHPKPQIEEIDRELLLGYIRDRTAFHARSTVSGVVSDLRGMGEFLVEQGLWRSNPLRWIRGPKLDPRLRCPRRIRREDLQKLWDAAERKGSEHARYRAISVLAVLYGTGLRRGELIRLDVDHWDRDAATLTIDGRKTGRARCVPVSEGVWRCIEAYLPYRHNVLESVTRLEERALFLTRHGERLGAQSVHQILLSLAKSAGVEHITLHQFRHSCASDLLEAGVRLPEVQKILGHACIVSTVRYLDIAGPERAAAMTKHPINEFLQGGAA
jgi:site-specific recombinase XerD